MVQQLDRRDLVFQYPGTFLSTKGPLRSLNRPYVAVYGAGCGNGNETQKPFAAELEDRIGETCVDLSVAHAGPDALLADKSFLEIGQGASAVVLTVPGAHELSNPYFRVHRWRNDRVIAQQDQLHVLYPEVEFESIHFVRHLLRDLHAVSAGRFAVLRETLQHTWIDRMATLLRAFDVPVILLWMGSRRPDERCMTVEDGDPPFVTREMVGALSVARRVEVISRPNALLNGKGSRRAKRVIRQAQGPGSNEQAAERVADALATLRKRAPMRGIDLSAQGLNGKRPPDDPTGAASQMNGSQTFSVNFGMASKRSATRP